jgi:hypothetical protein
MAAEDEVPVLERHGMLAADAGAIDHVLQG